MYYIIIILYEKSDNLLFNHGYIVLQYVVLCYNYLCINLWVHKKGLYKYL